MAIAISISGSDVTFPLQWKAAHVHLNLEQSPHPQDGGLFLILWSSSHFHPPWTTTSTELQQQAAATGIAQEHLVRSACQSHDTLRSTRTWLQSPRYRLHDNIKRERIHPYVNFHKQEYLSWLHYVTRCSSSRMQGKIAA